MFIKNTCRKTVFALFVAMMLMSVSSCDKKEEAASSAPAPVKAVSKPVEVKVEEKAPEPKVPAEIFVEGIRNPFKNPYIKVIDKDTGSGTPLTSYDVSAFNIKALIVGNGKESMAMLNAPDKKSYIAKVGTPIGLRGGKVVNISPAGVTVREQDEFTGEDVNYVIQKTIK